MENQSTVGRWSLLRLRTGRRQRRRRDERGTSGVVFLMMATSMFLLFTILVQYGINLYAARVASSRP